MTCIFMLVVRSHRLLSLRKQLLHVVSTGSLLLHDEDLVLSCQSVVEVRIVGLIIDIICYQVLKIQTVTLTSKLKSSVAEKVQNLNLEGESLIGPGEHAKVEVLFCKKGKMRGLMTK